MNKYQKDRSFYFFLVKVFLIVAFVGVVLLIYTSLQDDPSELAFSLIAFVVSVAALVLTTFQSLSIARQLRLTQRAADLVHETSNRLEELVSEDRKLSREIRQDMELDRDIIAVLEEFGVGDNEDERDKVARKIASLTKRPKD